MPLSWKVGNGLVEIVKAASAEEDWRDSEEFDRGGSKGCYWQESEGSRSDWEYTSDSNSGDINDSGSEDNEGSDCGDGEAVVAPISLALPEGDDGVARILVDPENTDSDKVNHGGQSSLPRSPGNRDESVAEIRFGSSDLNAEVTDFNSQPSLPPADSDERESASDPKDLVPTSSTEPSYPTRKSDTHPNNTRSTPPFVANRYWVIGSCVCILAFLAYRKNSRN